MVGDIQLQSWHVMHFAFLLAHCGHISMSNKFCTNEGLYTFFSGCVSQY